MHPSLVRSFVETSIAELRDRLNHRPDLHVDAVTLDPALPEMFISVDHDEYETEIVTAASPLLLPGGQQLTRQQRVPILGRAPRKRQLTIHMELDGFDLVPPTAELLGSTGEPLPADEWPTSFAGGGIVRDHPIHGRPFFCRRGFREYHSHPQHEDDPWAKWRDALPLHAIVLELLNDLHVRWHGAA